jgi:hypothetical protein
VIAANDIVCSPAWFPLEVVAGDAMRLVYLDEAAYKAASFLDQRLLGLKYEQTTCTLATIHAAATKLAPRSHYIFHTGHVGSTLISRLIGAHESFFSLREPALLRTVSDELPLRRGAPTLGVALALLARTWRTSQRAVIKVTSTVSELAELILAGEDHPRAIFMFTDPLAYLRGILAGPNSRVESRMLGPARLRRLVRRLDGAEWRSDPRSEGEQVAMNWLCEMTALHQAALRFESQVLWVNFDAFLSGPALGLQRIFRVLGAAPSPGDLEALVTGPLMRQYSKAPEHAYDAALRREVLLSADWEHGKEIGRGMDWLGKTAMRHPLIQAVLESSARVRSSP